MRFFQVTIMVVVLALMGSAASADAKVKKRRTTVKKERTMQSKSKAKATCMLEMVHYMWQGMMMYPVADVRVERRDGKVVLTTRGTVGEEKEFVLKDGEQLLQQALKIIERNRMLDYSSSYELSSEFQVLDGYAWEFGARLTDGRKVSSRGSNAEPDGDGLADMQDLLFNRAKKELGIDD